MKRRLAAKEKEETASHEIDEPLREDVEPCDPKKSYERYQDYDGSDIGLEKERCSGFKTFSRFMIQSSVNP